MMLRAALVFILGMSFVPSSQPGPPDLQILRDDERGELRVLVEGRKAFAYQYSDWWDLPHYWPLRSPSGKSLLVQQAKPYPHHRSLWVADTVRLEGGRKVSTYNALYSGQMIGKDAYGPPFRDRVRHVRFRRCESGGGQAVIEDDLLWEADGQTPVLDEHRRLVVVALGRGEVFLDLLFTLKASYGNVEFLSDAVHYAWPYLRMHPRFSGEQGGTITSDNGATGQEATNMQVARWIDYSNTVDGVTEGVAVFQAPDGQDHRWVSREYGTFGPRRPDNQSGRPFTLRKGETISQHVGILVHRGDARGGKVAERYQEFIRGLIGPQNLPATLAPQDRHLPSWIRRTRVITPFLSTRVSPHSGQYVFSPGFPNTFPR